MKRKIPDLNISIRYKILGAFLISALVPWVCQILGLNILQSTLAGLGVALVLGWYSSFRILSTITGLKALALKLLPVGLRKIRPFKDELTNLYYDFEHFMNRIGEEHGQQPSDSAPAAALDLEQRHEFQAELASGDSAFGLATLMPSKSLEELWTQNQQVGEAGQTLFDGSLQAVRGELNGFLQAPELNEQTRGIIEFQIMLLEDVSFLKGVRHYLHEGLSLTEALNTVFAMFVSQLEQSPNPYLKMRVNDLFDLKQRIHQSNVRASNPLIEDTFEAFKGKVVLCENIFPSEIISLKKAGVAGIVSVSGTAASHAEILLESFGIASLSCFADLPIHLMEGKPVLLDASAKKLILNYSEEDLKKMQVKPEAEVPVIREAVRMKSGETVWVGATINNPYLEASKALEAGADGIGLFRTEMGFMGRKTLPTEEELHLEYLHLMRGFSGKPVTFRLLDLGSDKLASFQNSDTTEENPCMGNRSMRLLIRRPDILRTQLRAILRAAQAQTTIILPMISGWAELLEVKKLSLAVIEELKEEGVAPEVKWGLMVEVPSLVECFETVVDFFDSFNIGSNDLTQYALAVDRNNKEVASYFRYTHPAVLSMIRKVVSLCRSRGKRVILCGEMASRLDLLPLCLGLGLRDFSVPYKKLAMLKNRIGIWEADFCQSLATRALEQRTPDEVETLLV